MKLYSSATYYWVRLIPTNMNRRSWSVFPCRQARNGAAVYGFQLDPFASRRCDDRLAPIPPGATKEERRRARDGRCSLIYYYILKICKTVWPDQLQLLSGYSKSHRHCIILVVIGCTRRNGHLIPHGESMQKLTDLVEEEVFTEGQVGFFRCHDQLPEIGSSL